ncbi:MAG: nucleotidyltransferase domain-containing protein [Cyanobacteria bacterium P01_C01_bin.118]
MVDQRFIDYWQQRQQQQSAQIEVLRHRAWQDVRQIAQILRQDFEVTGVFVYGSLLKERFTADSDIDIALAGLAKDRFYEAVAAVNDVCDRWVDLKPIESLEPYFWQRIQSQGIWVDEATEFDQLEGTSGGH